MSYCKFQNTLGDLADCRDSMEDADLSESELKARRRMIRMCKEIADDFAHELED